MRLPAFRRPALGRLTFIIVFSLYISLLLNIG